MQSTQSRYGDDSWLRSEIHFWFSPHGRLLRQRKVRAILTVIADILVHQSFQMTFVEHDYMVEQIPAAIADEALRHAVLPRASKTGSLGLDAEAVDRVDDFAIKARSAVEDEVSRRGVVRKCFAQLLDNPRAGWMSGDVAV